MKVVFFGMDGERKKYLSQKLARFQPVFVNKELSLRTASRAKEADAIGIYIYSTVNEEILQQLPKLKYIAAVSTGYDHIDMDACKRHKVKVSNIPLYGENTVAEHTFALLLALSRKIPESQQRTQHGEFIPTGLEGFDVNGKTLGVVGTGRIGRAVIRIAKGFRMKVIAYDVRKDMRYAKEAGIKYVPLNTLLQHSDVITLHAALNAETRHLINSSNIRHIRRGALLINTARGDMVDTHALIRALDKGILSGAGLDVLENECYIRDEQQVLHPDFLKECDLQGVLANHILLKKENVLITPHNAFNSREALQRILDTTVENLISFSRGKHINAVR